ncbi:MAG: class I SAM-dependent DNA methyltransferase [Myxococcota bacterium]|nr:class I SAM-dependent DNA methyltransferase [Myxococcota bacterium]
MPLTLPELSKHLWAAADMMRGAIDSSEYKHYIFGLLFYRRLCDVWCEEYEQNNGHHTRFTIPFGCLWGEEPRSFTQQNWPVDAAGLPLPRHVREKGDGVGREIRRALLKIEEANEALQGIFQDVDFSDPERFSDRLLNQLLDHFEHYSLRKADVAPSMLGDAYEYLIKMFADDGGSRGGEFYTPSAVVRLMVEILDPKPGMDVYDPTCGSGGMLLETMNHMRRQNHSPNSISLYGQEKNRNTWTICRIALFLNDLEKTDIRRGDTILEPRFLNEDGGLRTFDIVIANPPFSLKKWGHAVWKKKGGEPFGRAKYGVPPKGYGDFAFVQHMIASLKEKGRMGVVLPNGVLFRGGAERTIRKGLLEEDIIEAIVTLGNNLFYGASIPATILFLNKNKPKKKKKRVLIINAELELFTGVAQSHLSEQNVQRIVSAVQAYKDVPYFARVVHHAEIEENDYNLNTVRYVRHTPPPPPVNIPKVYGQIRKLQTELRGYETELGIVMKELGYDAL